MKSEIPNLKSKPDPSQLLQDGLNHHQAGALDDAIAAYRRLVELDPSAAEAWSNLGNALGDAGQIDDALAAYQCAIKINPNLERAYNNLGVTLRDIGRLPQAIAALHRAIELNPDSAVAWDNLGIALLETGRIDESLSAYERAIAIDPQSAVTESNRSIALRIAGRLEEAVATAETAIALKPDYPEAHNNLGAALADWGRSVDAVGAFGRAIQLRPNYSEAFANLGTALADLGEFDHSLTVCRKAVELDPANAFAHFNLAVVLLLLGHFDEGFSEYEWRWKCRGILRSRSFAKPTWKGEPLDGRTILLYSEQGLGDAIHFARYASEVAKLSGRVILECPAPLVRLMRSLSGIDQVIATDDPLPTFDVHCSIASLPHALGTTIKTIPAAMPYLKPDPRNVEQWRSRLAAISSPSDTLRIGLTWAGGVAHKSDRLRSLHLSQLLPLMNTNAIFVSLQKGPVPGQIADGFNLIDWTEEFFDLADTAALITQLDLVISVDTAVAHLAGALARPTWTLLPFNPDWRWMLNRDDSPWYPTMRLFRQYKRGAWNDVIDRVREELNAVV